VKQAHYSASKGAVVNLTRELALQWARKGVRVNALCPGWFPSEMTAGMDTDEASQAYVKNNSPIPRMGEAHELDGALLLLASDASSFMTGQTLVIDGGWTAR
jgi:NAD(P)-dependent dehydrogenase (short-subunit alcohol dehydrogenase family)